MFAQWLTVAPTCSACGLNIGAHDAGDGPAVLLIFVLGALVVPLALWLSFLIALPLWVHAVVWGIVILGLTVGMLRPAKALMVAVLYRRRAAGTDWQVPKAP